MRNPWCHQSGIAQWDPLDMNKKWQYVDQAKPFLIAGYGAFAKNMIWPFSKYMLAKRL
jgi:hypothetical protein